MVVLMSFVSFHLFEVVVSTDNEWVWSGFTGNQLIPQKFKIDLISMISLVFILNSLLFLPLGQLIAVLMSELESIKAYSINVVGSIVGIIVFTALSLLGQNFCNPVVWFLIISILTLWLIRAHQKWLLIGLLPCLALCFMVFWNSQNEIWSPYYNIQHLSTSSNSRSIYVNKFFHQRMIDFNQEDISKAKYSIPYKIVQPEDVLILGAGSGNDVVVALLNNAKHVDAVDIDPEILELGKKYNSHKPYDDPRVNIIVDDARTYLRKTSKKYDLVVFATLDSHALLSGQSSVRLDNFVYTVQSMQDVKLVLKPDGVVTLLFSVPKDWIGDKLLTMVDKVFPEPRPLAYLGDEHLFNLMIMAGPGITQEMYEKANLEYGIVRLGGVNLSYELPSDDWPYLYLTDKNIPSHYLVVISLLILLSMMIIGFVLKQERVKFDINFFALGAAFMLLETKSVVSLSQLFGSTWLVNAFVFAAILMMILIANCIIAKFSFSKPYLFYIGLAMSLFLNYITPLKVFLGHGWLVQNLFSAMYIALPIFFSSLLFAYYFKGTKNISTAFGANLLGAMLGGFIEYSSMLFGLNNLYIIAAIFYLISLISAKKY